MTMRFWVYVNHPNNKALVHEASCSHCNDGRGMTDDKSDFNGEWQGPFDRSSAAEARARASGKSTVRWCGFCARKHDIS